MMNQNTVMKKVSEKGHHQISTLMELEDVSHAITGIISLGMFRSHCHELKHSIVSNAV